MPNKRLYERGPMMPTVRETADEAKRVGAIASHDETTTGYPAIDRARDMIRKKVGMPPRSNGNGKPMRNGSDPPIKSKFE